MAPLKLAAPCGTHHRGFAAGFLFCLLPAALPLLAAESPTPDIPAAVPSFRNDVIPVLTKNGCNSGACHGAAAGKNGFHLTLRGYDIEADYYTLTRQGLGRRVVKTEPSQSLMLLKPSMAVGHGGGLRLPSESEGYKIVAAWIAGGAPGPSEADPLIERIETRPAQITLEPGGKTQIHVIASFSDGRTRDVTGWTKFSSGGESVATVSDNGEVAVRGPGEAPITAWYQSKVAFTRISVPQQVQIDATVFERAGRRNLIDEPILKKLAILKIPPSGPSGDGEFLRRAYLDTAGILPAAEETRRFLADRDPDKRTRAIDALLNRPEFVDYWSYKWADLFTVNRDALTAPGMWEFYTWLRGRVQANTPWDEMAREILVASGDSYENGPVNYYRIHRTPEDLTETTMQAFLGMRIMCARCHNHPFEKWTQNDYYGVASFFSRLSYKDGETPGDLTVMVAARGEIDHPRLGRPMPPHPLDGKAMPLEAPGDRRIALAAWITSPGNPYFSRAVVNRVWANFMGRGLIEPVDDIRATNPASNEELLATLSADFVEHKFDVRHLIRTILNSAAYQRTSQPVAENAADEQFYSHYRIKRLPAEVILDAMSQVTASPERFPGTPLGTRALELPDTRVSSYFLDVFGRPARVLTGESERQQAPSVSQALHILNGGTLNRKVAAAGGTIDSLLKIGMPSDIIIDHLYLSALSRYPDGKEKRALLEMVDGTGQTTEAAADGRAAQQDRRREALEDILWSLLSGKEFLFNH